ncbi:MAG: SusD/RagB family nutrient-binding outer membrane lipoprotein, partial [Marinilabiliaceae bacterium]|nr:SusD/RagB family nutrient-binding outer membrane lipoprotein [Marinilabiliaceae bacterium]
MRNIIYTLMLAFLMACSTESFEDVNKNIDELSGEDVNVLFLINNGISVINSFQGTALVTFMEWSHHTSWLNTPQGEYEHFAEGWLWHMVYSTNKNLVDALDRTTQTDNASDGDAHAMAHILRSYMFLRLTDSYGDVPYSEAGYEDENGIIDKPAYDAQRDIYIDVFSNLTEAIELIGDHGSINLGPADFVYNGDLQAWKKFANSLRLRMALRINNVDEALSNQWFSEVVKYPVIDSNEEAAAYARFDETSYRNPYYDQLSSGTRVHSSAMVVDQLQNTNDPRLPLFAEPINNDPSGTTFVGLPNGQSGAGILFDDYSFIGPIVYQADRPTPIFLYSEVCFIKAERYLLGIGGETIDQAKANTWYQNG